ncbi:glycosyltransferase family 4 protein [Sphingobacterium faecium]|uniref:glycosyltransferase family 4 protein n=1 Tax=Sphingobacterium faecium TaxID=34087 RepID=UPI00320B594D
MKILIISQYFWPENFRINDIALGLKDKGHEVVVLSGIPNYPEGNFFEGYQSGPKDEYWKGIKIYRSRLISRGHGGGVRLFLNYFSFAFFASLKIFKIKEDIDSILVFEPSPITVGIPAMVAKYRFKAPYSFWVQDLWPASLTAAGGVKNKIVIKIFDKLTKIIYKYAEKVLIQSQRFRDYILLQNVPDEKIVYVPNTTEDFYFSIKRSSKFLDLLPSGFKIIFAGNIGEAQSLDTFIDATKILITKGYPISWIIIGDGRYKSVLEKRVNLLGLENYIHFLGRYPASDMANFFSHADALYVTLRKDYIFSLTIPSKVQSYLACEKPILASLDGEGAKIIKESNSGFVSPAEDVNELVKNVIDLYELSNDERLALGRNGLEYFNREFNRNVVLDKLEKVLSV